MEYPGYGIYKGSPSADKILLDAENLYIYLTSVFGLEEENILVFGRSIGSGPAVYLASKFHPRILLLISAYTSIKEVAKVLAGSIPAFFFADRFRNIELIKSVRCPVLFIHGKMDTLIPHTQSIKMKEAATMTKTKIILPPLMDHNTFHFHNDILYPITHFLSEQEVFTHRVRPAPSIIPGIDHEEDVKNGGQLNNFIRNMDKKNT